jgi:hypothetical protein
MAKLTVTIEVDVLDHASSHHQHGAIGNALDQVKQAVGLNHDVGMGISAEGDITGPPEPLRPDPPVIGKWEFIADGDLTETLAGA